MEQQLTQSGGVPKSGKKTVLLIAGLVIMFSGRFAPGVASLSREAMQVILVLIGFLFLITTEAAAIGTASLLAMLAQVLVGMVPHLGAVLANGSHPLVWFALSASVIGSVIGKVPIADRLALFFMKRFGRSTVGMIFAFCIAIMIISAFVSNPPALIVITAISMRFLDTFSSEEDRRNTGRTMMIAFPIAAILGGFMTPVGNACMMLGSEYLYNAGYPVNFAQWMLAGVPISVIMLPILLFVLFKMYPPAKLSKEAVDGFISTVKVPERVGKDEIKVLAILGVTVFLWIIGSFFGINVVVVAVGCVVALILTRVFSWKEVREIVDWGIILMFFALFSLCTLLISTGVIDWILDLFLTILPPNASTFLIIFLLCIFEVIILVILPNSPAVAALFGLPMINIAASLNIHPGVMMLPMVMASTVCLILPFDMVFIIGYEKGFYKIPQLAKYGVVASLLLSLAFAIWFPVIFKVLGWL